MNRTDSVSRLDLNSVNSVIESNMADIIRWSSARVVLCATSGKAVVVPHDLGLVPTDLLVTKWGDSDWWVSQNDRDVWNDRLVVFHATFGRYTVRVGVR